MLSETEINEYVARQIRKLRSSTGISQTKLANETGMTFQQVQKYEWGINRITAGRVLQFAEAFDVPISTFFPKRERGYSDDPVPPPTLRFIRLISKIPPQHYDQVYTALKAIAKLSGSRDA